MALFLEHIPYMYMHLSTMLECKKMQVVSIRMQYVLLTVDNSDKQ